MFRQTHRERAVVARTVLLPWSPHLNATTVATVTLTGAFDLVVGADCLFFRDFHDDLVNTLDRLLHPIDGVAVLLQPERGGTMRQFLQKCTDSGCFHCEVYEDYMPQVRHFLYCTITTLHVYI